MKKNTLQKGFTMIELLIYMGIFSILLFVLFDMFTMILSTHAESQSTSSIDQDAGYMLNRLTYDIHRASTITTPSTLGITGSTSTLEVTNTSTGVDETYSVDGDNLILTDKSVTPNTALHLNSTNTKIVSISFTTLGNSAAGSKVSVQINVTLKSTVKGDTRSYQTTIQTR